MSNETRLLEVELEPGEFDRLDKLLARHLKFEHLTRSYLTQLIRQGAVSGPQGTISKASTKLAGPLTLRITLPAPKPLELEPENLPLEILFQDEHLVAINKAAGMAVHPGAGRNSGTLVHALLHHIKDLSGIGGVERPGIVHRLDMDTSGLIVVAKSDLAHQKLSEQFKQRTIKKQYMVWVHGSFEKDQTVEEAIGRDPKERRRMAVTPDGRNAETTFQSLYSGSHASKVLAQPKTGRTHQIRVHLKHLNRPVLHDALYGGNPLRLPKIPETLALRSFLKNQTRFFLHAWKLSLDHPLTGQPMVLEAPLPEEFLTLEKILCG